MITNIRAKFTNGHIVPLEPLDIEDGEEVTVTINTGNAGPHLSDADRLRTRTMAAEGGSPQGLSSLLQALEEIRESVPASEWAKLPTDGAANYKHYLYGHPKDTE